MNSCPIVKCTLGGSLARFDRADLYIGNINVQALAVVAWMTIRVVKVYFRMRFTWCGLILLFAITTIIPFHNDLLFIALKNSVGFAANAFVEVFNGVSLFLFHLGSLLRASGNRSEALGL